MKLLSKIKAWFSSQLDELYEATCLAHELLEEGERGFATGGLFTAGTSVGKSGGTQTATRRLSFHEYRRQS